MNNLTIIGRFTKDPVLRTVKVNGKDTAVCNFFVACDDGNRKDKDGKRIGTEFFKVTAWRGAAEAISSYCFKGRNIAVKGAVHIDHYEQNGKTFWHMSIPNPDGFEFIGASGETEKKVVNETPDAPEDSLAALVEQLPWE